MKIVCMIPARLGSKRVPHKNLRILAGKILMGHVIDKAKKSGCFDAIYINSESPIFKKVADKYDVKFYQRPPEMASDEALNDDFVLDFIDGIAEEERSFMDDSEPYDIIVQINPTNPLITVDDIKAVVGMSKYYDTVHSVKKAQIELMYERKPVNFSNMEKMPRSQELVPAILFSSGIMAWKIKPYREHMTKYGCATYGCGENTGYYELKGFSTVDIDNEEDFQLVEAILKMEPEVIEYYGPHRK